MSAPNTTPGPWVAEHFRSFAAQWVTGRQRDNVIYEFTDRTGDYSLKASDLVEAAVTMTELYEALELTITRVSYASEQFHNSQHWHGEEAPDGVGSLWDWVFSPADAALAKARGEA